MPEESAEEVEAAFLAMIRRALPKICGLLLVAATLYVAVFLCLGLGSVVTRQSWSNIGVVVVNKDWVFSVFYPMLWVESATMKRIIIFADLSGEDHPIIDVQSQAPVLRSRREAERREMERRRSILDGAPTGSTAPATD